MLGVHRLTSAGADYYLADMAQELPLPARWDEGAARWAGSASAGLGLHGAPDPAALRAVLDGRHPTSGHRLRSDRATVRGFDLTFSAPKSVSVVFALGGDDVARQVVGAHRESVRGALSYLEQHGLSARRGSGEERQVVPTTGLVAASFTHGVNRNLDPHLHTHVVMANMVHGLDGRWSACDHRGLSAHRGAASAIYESHLRRGAHHAPGGRVGGRAAPGFRSRRASPPCARRVLVALGRYPPAHVRAGFALGPGCPHRVGCHPTRKARRGPTSVHCRRGRERQARAVGSDRTGIRALLGVPTACRPARTR